MEKTLDVVNCDLPTLCPISGNCKLKFILNQAADAFLDVLDQYTVADLQQAPNKLKALLHIQTL